MDWERPNPPRLNDTSALVSKGTYPYQVKLRGNKWTSPLETPWNPENAFKGHSSTKFASNPSPDGNGRGALSDACKAIPKGC